MGLRAALFFFSREVAKRESQLMPWTHLPANILSTLTRYLDARERLNRGTGTLLLHYTANRKWLILSQPIKTLSWEKMHCSCNTCACHLNLC